MNTKILCLLHLPPPDYGVTLSNQRIIRGRLKQSFALDPQAINTSRFLSHIERISLGKVFLFFRIFCTVLFKLIRHRYRGCYFSLTPTGVGFYKDFILVVLLKLFRVKTLYHLHGKGIAQQKNRLSKTLYRICFKGASVVVLSPSLGDDIARYVKGDRIFSLSNGIHEKEDIGDFQFQAKKDNCIHLLFLSNMIRSKGVFTALEVAERLKDKGYEFVFAFAGDWFDITEDEFNGWVRDMGIGDQIVSLGFVRENDKYRLLCQSDIFVYPTYHDAFPSVILEAMQCGLPVVSTSEGAIPDMIEAGKTGFVVDPHSVDQLTQKTEELIKKPQLRKAMGEAAREKFLREYTFEKFEQGLIDIFNKVFPDERRTTNDARR